MLQSSLPARYCVLTNFFCVLPLSVLSWMKYTPAGRARLWLVPSQMLHSHIELAIPPPASARL